MNITELRLHGRVMYFIIQLILLQQYFLPYCSGVSVQALKLATRNHDVLLYGSNGEFNTWYFV